MDCFLASTAAMPVFGILTRSVRKEEGKDPGGPVASEKRVRRAESFLFRICRSALSGSREGDRYLCFRQFFCELLIL